MKIKFKNIIIHNFLSFGDAEVRLNNRGYCVVQGINHNPKDAALSNGSGKSTMLSALCWALTGQTIQGISKNICNMNLSGGCWVKLFFTVDENIYEVTRYKDFESYGSDLKILINNEDRSGKGIRESEALLAEYLPDLNNDLISNVILLGQGLPSKFTAYSPSDRKKLLEKLSKSDFMIEDLKNRLDKRLYNLNEAKRKFEDDVLILTSKLSVQKEQLNKEQIKLTSLCSNIDYSNLITEAQSKLVEINNYYLANEEQIKIITSKIQELESLINANNTNKNNELNIINSNFLNCKSNYFEDKSNINSKINLLNSEINKLKSIRDICPTCGQKIPNVIKPDTSTQETALSELLTQLQTLENQFLSESKKVQESTNLVENKYYNSNIINNNILNENKTFLKKLELNNKQYINDINTQNQAIYKLQLDKENYDKNRKESELAIIDIQKIIKQLDENILYNITEKDKVQEHLSVITKMQTFVKRDFRGFLLGNIITFINKKGKEYAKDIFGVDNEFEFKLDGNNIDISYSKKPYENLSGGEKQKIDLIIQFAIRDMLTQYLNFSSNCLFLDEIFDNLDMIGCTNVLNLISSKLTDIESIFIISHHADLDIPYDDQIIVEKDRNGVSSIK